MDIEIRRALALLDAWLEDHNEEPLEKEDVLYIINFIGNRYANDRKSFERICEALNKRLLGEEI